LQAGAADQKGTIMSPNASNNLWAVVMAGGDGLRLRPLVRSVCGDDRPRQFAPLLGAQSLLRQTLDRVAQLVPPRRTVVSATRPHAEYLAAETLNPRVKVLLQPSDRGTAAGLLYPVHWIRRIDPAAVVVSFPSDHFVIDDGPFMSHVGRVAAYVAENPSWLVLVGARPSSADPGYGWVERAETLSSRGSETIWRVRRLLEKPTPDQARSGFARGHLWSTFVMAATAETFVNAGRYCLPNLHIVLSDAVRHAATFQERDAIEAAYQELPTAGFSETVLSAGIPRLGTSCLPPVAWSDLGTPERLARMATILAQRRPSEDAPAAPLSAPLAS
jgi:mannose-1-phosphate guanylyltransferase